MSTGAIIQYSLNEKKKVIIFKNNNKKFSSIIIFSILFYDQNCNYNKAILFVNINKKTNTYMFPRRSR